MQDMKLIAEPDMEKLTDFVKSSVDNLCNAIMENEERLILDSMPHTHLVLLQHKVNEAVERSRQKLLTPNQT